MDGSILVIGIFLILPSCTKASHACDDTIYCQGPLLHAVQTYGLYNESKTFVDMEMVMDRADVLANYAQMEAEGPITKARLQDFMSTHFTGPGDELEPFVPEDWTDHPEILDRVHHGYREWVLGLNDLWKTLGRKVKSNVGEYPDRHSLIYVPNPFIVPGGRFREYYYWDTYWIIKGLLVTGMTQTARMVIENFLHVLQQYGFIPNGGRVYYTNRSQPPLLIQMVASYYEATQDLDFVRQNFELLQQEYNFWRENRTVSIEQGEHTHKMFVYSVNLTYPRPEGYVEDRHITMNLTPSAAEEIYENIASAAESGWDFSSRWLHWEGPDALMLRSIKTKKIVPVDLNTYLVWNAKTLATFAGLLGDSEAEAQYEQYAASHLASLEQLMWNEEQGAWFDYDLESHSQRLQFYPSNIFPLLVLNDSQESGSRATKVIQYIMREGIFLYPGGIPASGLPTGQQWDFPNAWPPLVSLFINALAGNENPLAQQAALNISQIWLNSNHLAWKKYGHMFEKYDATKSGECGGGGEYTVQTGFGWTNGVVLELLDKYATQLRPFLQPVGGYIGTATVQPVIAAAQSTHTTLIVLLVLAVIIAVLAVGALVYYRRRDREQDYLLKMSQRTLES